MSLPAELQSLWSTRDLSVRFRIVFNLWLGSLPRSGWSGTVRDLADALEEHVCGLGLHHGVRVPAGAGLTRSVLMAETEMRAAGWRVKQSRTAKERTIEFARVAKARGRGMAPAEAAT